MSALRILYLEDNADHVVLVAESLQFQFPGSQVENTPLLSEAVACLGGRQYDAVLVNAHLHGESIVPRLQEIVPLLNGTPIIVISGNGDEKSAANAIKHGASDYLVKSRESLEVLPYLIQRLLKKRRPGSDQRQMSFTPSAVDHLIGEIDQVARRVHTLQDNHAPDTAIQDLREELQQLKQFALQLSETSKNWKTKS